ncbi:hypothetical protein HNP73_002756 [Amaricoccus macauensis]|uniref:Virulence factor n=1 Tax=Amaricoccus macauensis TaxID=57001 RepID=A0A840SPZ8_9RHOB|nr:virulence factor SrfC family protein [Amaricoccus macauensis]MBB5222820.1 hypothetical protein [Amaricoccus macauensis]
MTTEATPFLRDKDRALGDACRQAATAAIEAVDWLAENRDPSAKITILQKQLRRHAVDARRLAVAAERPMSVGVFGASQMGKSFLIGKLITPPGRAVKVVFGSGDEAVRQDFLEQVNPAGGDETTGLVTRFSLRSRKTPPGYPVVLRTLREVDIVKILANSFQFDLKGQYRLQVGPDEEADIESRVPTDESITALAAALGPLRAAKPQPGFALEVVFELREYIQRNVRDHLMAGEIGEAYWTFLEETLPFLDVSGRVRALSLLWADIEEFNELYLTLKRALDQLGHPSEVFTSLSALADRARGVLHVDALQDLDATGAVPQLNVLSEVPGGGLITLPVAVASALTAELFVTLEEAPWEFLTHTDLLDFPGARSRGRKSVWEVLRKPEEQGKHPRSQCFRRGKVAVLFDNYADDLDLNAMLLCKDHGNQEVAELGDLVLGWIRRTHGASPEQRRGKPPALFFCMTKCDIMLGRTTGNDDPVQKRFDNNLRKSFGGGWITEWTPGQPFRNVFMLRNPGVENAGFFTYAPAAPGKEVGEEIGYADEFSERLTSSLRPRYLADDLVRAHVEDPELKFDALLALNDGGSTLLAERLAPICNPDLKYDQIASRAEEVRTALQKSLIDFYESGDIGKRVAERVGRMETLVRALDAHGTEIGPFIADFQVDEPLIEAAYLADRRGAGQSAAKAGTSSIFAAFENEEEDEASGFGATVLDRWASNLSERVPGSPWCIRLDIDEEVLRAFVNEIVGSADRLGTARRLEERLDAFTLNSLQLSAAARRVSIFGALTLNDLVSYPGGRSEPSNAGRFVRLVPPGPGEPCDLPENPRALDRLRKLYFLDWMRALLDLARDNASTGQAGGINVAANEKLGRILARLGEVPQ